MSTPSFANRSANPYWCSRSIDFRAEPRHDTAKLYERLLRDRYTAQAAG